MRARRARRRCGSCAGTHARPELGLALEGALQLAVVVLLVEISPRRRRCHVHLGVFWRGWQRRFLEGLGQEVLPLFRNGCRRMIPIRPVFSAKRSSMQYRQITLLLMKTIHTTKYIIWSIIVCVILKYVCILKENSPTSARGSACFCSYHTHGV